MDSSYKKQWDETLTDHVQLQLDTSNGTEAARTIKKKFPLLGDCGWALTPLSIASLRNIKKKYVRARYFRSGWRNRKVPGKNASEIKMFHQEDAGLNVEMAKLAFAKGMRSYVLRMECALRAYSAYSCLQTHTSDSSITLIQKRLNCGKQKLRRPFRRALANSQPLGDKVAVAYFLAKLHKRNNSCGQSRSA